MAIQGLFKSPLEQILNVNAAPGEAASMLFTAAGTSTPKAIYTSSAYTTQLANPLTADSEGRFPAIYMDGLYRVAFFDGDGNELPGSPVDNLSGTIDETTVTSLATSAATSAIAASISAAFTVSEPTSAAGDFSYTDNAGTTKYAVANSFSNAFQPTGMATAVQIDNWNAGNRLAVELCANNGAFEVFVTDQGDLSFNRLIRATSRKVSIQTEGILQGSGESSISTNFHKMLQLFNPAYGSGTAGAAPGITFETFTSGGNLKESGIYGEQGRLVFYVEDPSSSTKARAAEFAYNGGSGDLNVTGAYYVDGVQVLSNRSTGWGTPSGTQTRTTFNTATVTTQELAERVYALLADLNGHGIIGLS